MYTYMYTQYIYIYIYAIFIALVIFMQKLLETHGGTTARAAVQDASWQSFLPDNDVIPVAAFLDSIASDIVHTFRVEY